MIIFEKIKQLFKNYKSNFPAFLAVMLGSLIILMAIIIAVIYFAVPERQAQTVEVSGRAEARFRVYYLDNVIFEENPISPNLHFLMSFTDYLEVDGRFNADFSEEVEFYYTYTASKRFVIRHVETGDGNLNPIVFQKDVPLSQGEGNMVADSLRLPGNSGYNANGNWGTYVVDPREYVDLYFEFIEEQRRQMYQEGIHALNLRGFSGELFVDFEYEVYIPEWGIRETASHGYRMLISTEVYFLATTGNHTFNGSIVDEGSGPIQLTLPRVVIYVLLVCLGVYGILKGIKGLQAQPNPKHQKALDIIKKYSNEIVVTSVPLPIEGRTPVHVDEFDPLLRLAINLNKHISCFHDSISAEFVVIVDEYAYSYQIDYEHEDDSGVGVGTPGTRETTEEIATRR
ncbi:MAG: DUF5305 domain-containing protein [Defluviitaleaceae bacterium]|nr:DUF5305 domain-containing protein [Defluviitaleaceae bacterium]